MKMIFEMRGIYFIHGSMIFAGLPMNFEKVKK